jgi:asparagine synthase (glutamine-hydrolysing)
VPGPPVDSLRPTDDELCVAVLFGQDPGTEPMRLGDGLANDARPIIERQLQVAMLRGPLWVSFSGGRDSSALLAIAASVARREGLPLPIPVTLVFPGVAVADEEAWQRLVLSHLDLEADWVRVAPGDDLDMIGPYAERVLTRHGVMLPPNSHAVVPMLEAMGEGTLVSGSGGDEILEGSPQRLTSALWSRTRIERGEVRHGLVNDLSGRLLEREVRRHSLLADLYWVTPAARARLTALEIADRAAFPIRFDRLLERAWTDRHFQMGRYAYDQIAADAGVEILQPFREREVVAAVARAWGYRHPGGRIHTLRPLVGDLLPEAALARQSKAEFVNVFATDRLRDWVRKWDGSGVDQDRANVDALRHEWSKPSPHYCSFPLLQQAWLRGH